MDECYVVVSKRTKVRVSKAPGIRCARYPTRGAAKAAATRCQRTSSDPNHNELVVMTYTQYQAQLPQVEVISLMSGKPVMISAEDVGGSCDPSTEHHWSM